jgi:hypothetical protein
MVMAPTSPSALPDRPAVPAAPWQLKLAATGLLALVAAPLAVAFDLAERAVTAALGHR